MLKRLQPSLSWDVILPYYRYFQSMKTTGFIARRYLFSKKHISLISTLTAISIAGVTIGIALLIVVLSVFNGFFDVIKGFLLQNDPDIRIESVEQKSFPYTGDTEDKLSGILEITAVSPFVTGKALMVQSTPTTPPS